MIKKHQQTSKHKTNNCWMLINNKTIIYGKQKVKLNKNRMLII